MAQFLTYVIVSYLFLAWIPNALAQEVTEDFGALAAAIQLCRTLSAAQAKRCESIVELSGYMDRAVVESCGNRAVEDNVVECLAAGARRTDPRAVHVCRTFFASGPSYVRCLKSIANKSLSGTDIRDCENEPYGDEIIECFKERGKEWTQPIPQFFSKLPPEPLPVPQPPPVSSDPQTRRMGGLYLIGTGSFVLFWGVPILLIGGFADILDSTEKKNFCIAGGILSGTGAIMLGTGIALYVGGR